MKNGKLNKASLFTKVLLGLAVAGALLFAGCQDIFDTSAQTPKGDGYGYVRVTLGDEAARTVRPGDGAALKNAFTKIEYKFVGVDPANNWADLNIEETWNTVTADETVGFRLAAGWYRVSVDAYTGNSNDGYTKAATGKYKDAAGLERFQIVDGGDTPITVYLTPVEDKTQNGIFKVRIKLPSTGGPKYTIKFQQFSGPNTPLSSEIKITLTSGSGDDTGWFVYSNTSQAAGTYRLTGRINTDNAQYAGFSEAVHIVSNMQTTFERDFTTTDALATVKDPDEAIAILKDELESWLTPTPNNVNVLASVSAVEKLDAAGTIRFNYIGTEMAKITAQNTLFTLQGGWQVTSRDGITVNNSWALSNLTSSNTFTLTNNKVTLADSTTSNPKYVTYKVELRPVAEFRVSYGDDVNDEGQRGITSFKASDGNEIPFPAVGSNLQAVRKAISVTGATAITTKNAAITIGPVNAPVAYPVDASGVVTPAFTAESAVYEVKIYQTADDQIRAAWQKMRAEIAYRPTIKPDEIPGVTGTWLDTNGNNATTSAYLALSRDDPTKDEPVATPGNDGKHGTYTIYYVWSRLGSGNPFTINVPRRIDPRWAFEGNWNVTYDNTYDGTTANPVPAGDTKTISYTPYGGQRVTYDVKLIPVVEFEVTMASTNTTNPALSDPGTSLPSSTTKISIKEPGSAPAVEFPGTATIKRFALGDQTFALTDATITMDEATADTLENVYIGGPSTGASDKTEANIVQQSTNPAYKVVNAKSRVYKVKVYRSLSGQKEAAAQLVKEQTNSRNWVTTASAPGTGLLKDFAVSTASGVSNTSNLVYVKSTSGATAEIVIDLPGTNSTPALPANSVNVFTTANGWAVTDASDQGTIAAATGSKDVKVKFTPRGGLQADVYTFTLIAAARYSVKFGKQPIGNDIVVGSVPVAATLPEASSQTTVTYSSTAQSVVEGDNVWVKTGTANKLSITSSSTNIFGINFDVDGTIIANGKAYGTSVEATTLQSTDYSITVYPSVDLQKSNVLAGLKAVRRLDNWGVTSVKDGVPDNVAVATQTLTEFQVVAPANFVIGTTLTMPPVLPAAGGFLNPDYTGKLASTAGTDAGDFGKGIRDDTITFTPLQGSTGNEKQDFKFKLVLVARYNVVFRPGPKADETTTGNIQIRVINPGTGTLKATADGVSHTSDVKSIIGGIGTLTGDAKVIFSSSVGNVFRKGTTGTSYINGAAATSNTIEEQNITSGDYTIEVYPKIVDQQDQVVQLLKASKNNNVTFFGTRPTSNDPLITAITAKPKGDSDDYAYSEVQYVDSSAPFVGVATTGSLKAIITTNTDTANGGYAYDLVAINSGTGGATTDSNTSVITVPIKFTPIAPTADATPTTIYNIKLIPVARYEVKYGNGARGQVTITPRANGPRPAFVANNDTQNIYGGLGASTTISILAMTDQYDILYITGDDGYSFIIRKGDTNQFVTFSPSSQNYLINPVKNP